MVEGFVKRVSFSKIAPHVVSLEELRHGLRDFSLNCFSLGRLRLLTSTLVLIEHPRDEVKSPLDKQPARTRLGDAIFRTWESITRDPRLSENQADSMPPRCAPVIAGHSKY